MGRALPHLVLLYPTELGNSELPPSILATPASEIGVPNDVDLDFIANRKGAIDVTHRIALKEIEGNLKTVWEKADGVTTSTKVRVRRLIYNHTNNVYEFTRDGDTKPSLVWTPAITPQNSSTLSPGETPVLPTDPGDEVSPASHDLGGYPTYDIEELENYILVFPKDSGIDPLYVVFIQRVGDHRYYSKPDSLPAFPEAKQVRGKTRVQGGGYIRPRWVDENGHIYEWDLRHGMLEKYNKRGVHLGEFNHHTGVQTKQADPARRIEP